MPYPTLRKLTCASLLACLPALAFAQWFTDAGIEVLVNDNLSRSAWNGAEDTGLSASASSGYYWQSGDYTGISLLGSVQKTVWESWSGMNELNAGIGMGLRHKFGIGETVPVLNLQLGFNQHNYNSSIRDADVYSAGISLSKRFTPALQLTLGASHERSDGDHEQGLPTSGMWPAKSGKVWDYSAWTLSLQGELDLNEVSWLNAALQYRNGDVVSTGISYTGNAASLASTYDPAFGPHAVAYRLDARTHIYTLDYNRALWRSSTWYAGAEYQTSRTSSGIDYKVGIMRTGFIHGF